MIFRLDWWLRWSKILGGFAAIQGLVQVLNGVTGFLLVRSMGKEDYAWFTIINSLLATIGILTDSGLGSAMSSQGGPICNDKPRFAELMVLTKRLRFAFLLLALLVALPAGIYVLHLNHAPPWITGLLMFTTIMSAIPAAEGTILSSACRLHSRLRQILQADTSVSLTRLGLVFAAGYAGMTAVIATAITAVAQWVQLLVLRRQTHDLVSVPHEDTGTFRAPMLAVVKQMLPLCIFQCIQGQITTWVLSFCATTSTVADVGALSRLGIISTFLFVPLFNIVYPMIARATEPRQLRKLSALLLAVSLLISLFIVGLGVMCSKQILWVLGAQYGHLHRELVWYMAYVSLGFFGNIVWGIVLTRSWVKHGWIHIPITIVLQVCGAFYLDLSKATDTILFAGLSNFAGLFIALTLVWRGLAAANQATPASPMAA